jgi:hypothetical protein
MVTNYEAYKEKAIEACKQVFFNEYNHSIGIPLPNIEFILPDSNNYKSGEYYIRVGDTWQIYLNFGILPTSYKDFQEEVRVLTRHEVEHYMCCPFDVLTHFRMLKAIIDTYHKHYSHHLIDIVSLSGSLANQAADIIIDTKNFYRHKSETLKSEISWIKKGGNKSFKDLPRHSKLMFLSKEAIWKESLELFEDDDELIAEIDSLAIKFLNDGIDNKSLFISKTIDYTHSFFKLFEQDRKEEKQQENSESELNQSNSQQSGQPQITPSKDSQEDGSQFVFQSPDKMQEALEQLAQESSLDQFSQILSAAGLKTLSVETKQKIWFEAQNADIIPLSEQSPTVNNDNYAYPTSWKLGDPLEEMDMMLSFATSPIIIPGVTTKKWVQNPVFNFGSENTDPDLLLVVDTSGSMGSIIKSKDNLHQAVLASFGILKYFESKSTQVALIGFSDRITADITWTKDYNFLRESLLLTGGGGTNFPISNIKNTIENTKNPVVTVVITDGEVQNLPQTINYFKESLNDGNKLFIFLQDKKTNIENFRILIEYGAKVLKTITASEMRDAVLNEVM